MSDATPTTDRSGGPARPLALLLAALIAYATALGLVVVLLATAPIEAEAALMLAYALVFALSAVGVTAIFKRFAKRS